VSSLEGPWTPEGVNVTEVWADRIAELSADGRGGAMSYYGLSSYGQSCHAWDAGFEPFCNNNIRDFLADFPGYQYEGPTGNSAGVGNATRIPPPNGTFPPGFINKKNPRWCSQQWCYVDRRRCINAFDQVTTVYLAELNLTWSYEACLNPDFGIIDLGAEAFSQLFVPRPPPAPPLPPAPPFPPSPPLPPAPPALRSKVSTFSLFSTITCWMLSTLNQAFAAALELDIITFGAQSTAFSPLPKSCCSCSALFFASSTAVGGSM